MPLFAAFLSAAFELLFSILKNVFSTKVALVVAALGIFAAGLGTLWFTLEGLVNTIRLVLPPADGAWQFVYMGFWLLMPDNWTACVSAYFSADAAIFLYQWQKGNVKAALYVT